MLLGTVDVEVSAEKGALALSVASLTGSLEPPRVRKTLLKRVLKHFPIAFRTLLQIALNTSPAQLEHFSSPI